MGGQSLRDIGREDRLRAAGKTNRADAERELNNLRLGLSQPASEEFVEAQVRVRSSVRVVNSRWVEVRMQLRVDDSMPWLDVLNRDHPVLMRRTKDDLFAEYVELAIRRFLIIDAGLVWHLGPWEQRVGQGVTEYRAWLNLRGPAGVAVRTRDDGMLNVYAMKYHY